MREALLDNDDLLSRWLGDERLYKNYSKFIYLGKYFSMVRSMSVFSNIQNPTFIDLGIKKIMNGSKDIQNIVMDSIYANSTMQINNNSLIAFDKRSLWLLLNELFINHDYFFQTKNKHPYIIDCGSSYGMSIFYFKMLHPNSKILAFEPQTDIRKILEKNIEKNNFTNVTILPYALSDKNQSINFYVSNDDCLGASINKNLTLGETKTYKVESKKLSKFIDKKVDFLKLDIEGPEDKVLGEIEHKLHLVDRIFCEYHSEENENSKRLTQILTILDNGGFNVNISKSYGSDKYTKIKPFKYIGRKYSLTIFASKIKHEY